MWPIRAVRSKMMMITIECFCVTKTESSDMKNRFQTKGNLQKHGGRWYEPFFSCWQPDNQSSHANTHTASCSHFTRALPRRAQKVFLASPSSTMFTCFFSFTSIVCLSPENCPVTSAPYRILFLSDLWHHPLPDLISLYRSQGHRNSSPHRWPGWPEDNWGHPSNKTLSKTS